MVNDGLVQGDNSVIEHLPTMHEALGLMPSAGG